MRIYLMRHAQTSDNLVRRYTGNSDKVGINKEGEMQLKNIVPFLESKDIQVILSSPFKRCLQTALELKKFLRVNLITDRRLRELDYGKWQGLTSDEVKEKFPEIYKARGNDPVNVAPPEGETLLEMQKRVFMAIRETISVNKDSLIITHGSCIHAILMCYLKVNLMDFWIFSQKYKLGNSSISEVILLKNKVRIGKIGWYPQGI